MEYRELTAEDFKDKTPEEIFELVSENEKGLKTKNSELLGKIDGYKGKISETETAAEEARRVAAEKEELRLKAEGDMEGLKSHYETQLAEATAKLELEAKSSREALLQRDLTEVHSDIMRGVHENFTPAAEALLKANTNITYNDKGEKQVSIRHGDKEFNSTADFKEFAKTDPTWSAMLKAPDTKGTGANNSTSGQAASDGDSAFRQRLRDSGLIN